MLDLDLFAGPGGWDVAARELGCDPLGVELDADACLTRAAAGHRTIIGDVAELSPDAFAPCRLLIASPPCPTFSAAGSGSGTRELAAVGAAASTLARTGTMPPLSVSDPRTALVLEPLRYAVALRPDLLALEQVPAVLPLWRAYAFELERLGYRTWAGELNAADYGTPQVRRRAILLAAYGRPVRPPEPTHSELGAALTILGDELQPWITMAAALGWGMTERPYATVAGSSGTPGRHVVGGSASRDAIDAERARGRWVMNTGRDWQPGGSRDDAQEVSVDEPATAVMGDPRIAAPGYRTRSGETMMADAERVELHEAGILQGFPPDYPWRGRTRTAMFQQVGNAVPPPLARAILAALLAS